MAKLEQSGDDNESMRQLDGLTERLSQLGSDEEIASVLWDEFSRLGEIDQVYNYSPFTRDGSKRFLVHFKNAGAAMQAVSQYNLETFGFCSVWVKLG